MIQHCSIWPKNVRSQLVTKDHEIMQNIMKVSSFASLVLFKPRQGHHCPLQVMRENMTAMKKPVREKDKKKKARGD